MFSSLEKKIQRFILFLSSYFEQEKDENLKKAEDWCNQLDLHPQSSRVAAKILCQDTALYILLQYYFKLFNNHVGFRIVHLSDIISPRTTLALLPLGWIPKEEYQTFLSSLIIEKELAKLFQYAKDPLSYPADPWSDILSACRLNEEGLVITPPEICQIIVNRLEIPKRLFQSTTPTLIDISCGTGVFFRAVIRESLIEYIKQQKDYRGKELGSYMQKFSKKESRTLLEEIHTSLHGLDKNPLLVVSASVSTLVALADIYRKSEFEKPLELCIEVGNSLEIETEHQLQSLDSVIKRNNFDYVIGNPPYVRSQNISPHVRKKIRKHYRTAEMYNFDLYIPFFEKGMQLLTENGRLGYITPRKFFHLQYGAALRSFLATNFRITEIIDLMDLPVFDKITIYPAITFIEKSKPKPKDHVQVYAIKSGSRRNKKSPLIALLSGKRISDHFESFLYPQGLLCQTDPNTPWTLVPSDTQSIIEHIEDVTQVNLGKIVNSIFQGIITGCDKIFLVRIISSDDEDPAVVQVESLGDPYDVFYVERKILRKILHGKDITKWSINWENKWLIFPYYVRKRESKANQKEDSLEAQLIPIDELQTQFPLAWSHFEKHKERLENRERGKWRNRSDWYAYSRKQNLHLFERPKIITQVLARQSTFAYDEKGQFFFVGGGTAGGYGIMVSSAFDPYFLLGLLNSSLLEFYHHQKSSMFRGGYYAYGKASLFPLPIKLPETDSEGELIQKISTLVNLNHLKKQNKGQVHEWEQEIDELVKKLYSVDKFNKKFENRFTA